MGLERVARLPKPDIKDEKRMNDFSWEVYHVLIEMAAEFVKVSRAIDELKREIEKIKGQEKAV